MKKILFMLIGLLFLGFSSIAQENTDSQTNSQDNSTSKTCCKKEKKDKQLLPMQGDWAVGVDMLPLLRTLGTVFWGEKNPMGFQGTPYFKGPMYPNVSIMAKYMVTNNCAIRANLGVTILSTTVGDKIRDDEAFFIDNATAATVTDFIKSDAYGLSIAIGAEYRLGNKRVVGVFGGDLLIGYYTGSIKNCYGNKMTEFNQQPTTNQEYFSSPTSYYTRALFQKNNGAISAGAQVTAGVEIFVAPKIALGGQVNLSYVFTYNNQTYRNAEGFNQLYGKVEKRTDIQTPAGWSHKFDTNNLGGSLYMIFYF
ncbi:MAG: hypothetical protein LBU83_10950 [Bacteroidales bacterium]|jgi:hypothetical protein|nr:hypothetical protein [Bacteroidales bacterium]